MMRGLRYLLVSLLMLIGTLAVKAEDSQSACDSLRLLYQMRDSISAQSYVAQVNLQRARYEVNELTLKTQKRRASLVLYLAIGSMAVLALVGVGTYNLSRKNRQLKAAQVRLEKAQNEAINSTYTMNLFLSNMSHEIRTPLNALSGFSTILTDSNIDADTRQQCNEIIQQNSDLLVKLIDDVVDLSNLEKGLLQFRFSTQEVVSICRKVVDTVERIKQTAAEVRFESSLNQLPLYTDEARLQQLLINLLINATKFTSSGSITLTLEVIDGMAHFAVTDTGCGIAPEQREKVFNRFEKLNEKAQGTGLGLSICRLIIEHFGGKIWIDPDYHTGTRFCFTHPLPTAENDTCSTTGADKAQENSMTKEGKESAL